MPTLLASPFSEVSKQVLKLPIQASSRRWRIAVFALIRKKSAEWRSLALCACVVLWAKLPELPDGWEQKMKERVPHDSEW